MTLAVRLAALDEAVQAAETLGLDAEHASEVAADARRRLSFPGSAYVLALAGGTGVGKSSLLNAIAGEVVSRAGARRPTTAEPVAWAPAAARAELGPLLEWLGVTEIREHGDDRARGVAILDLPDLDSIAPEHRARVDELLPRVDAVIWVADPEKYHDAVLQDAYIRTWAPRLARQLFVVNKADRLRAADADGVLADAGRRFREHGIDMPLAVASASDGEAGIAQVRKWIAEGADAKRVVAERIAASARDATLALAERAGVAASDAPLVAPARRELARRDLVRESLAVLDMRGFGRQAVAATRLEARPRGAGPLGHLTAWIYRWSGRAQVAADPAAYLRRWRDRSALARAAEPVRSLVAEAVASAPPALRQAVARIGDDAAVSRRIADALDRSAAVVEGHAPPRSLLWPLIGGAQYVVTALLLFAAIWVAFAMFASVAVGTSELPGVGAVPTPLVLLAAALVAGFVLARVLGAHAGWLGRRWAARLGRAVSADLAPRLDTVLAPLDALEAARARLARAARVVSGS